MNYFELLGITPDFTLDLAQLESAYFAAQRQFHPDRFVNKSAEEKLRAAQMSADVNEAYNTLKHPLKRAQHLLALQDITVLDDANSAKPNAALLMEIMELQEAIAEGGKPDLAALCADCEKTLAHAFAQHDVEAAKTLTIRLSYLYKLFNY